LNPRCLRCRLSRDRRWPGLEFLFIVAFNRTSTHDGRPNPLFDDVLLLFLVDGSLHAFDVDWF